MSVSAAAPPAAGWKEGLGEWLELPSSAVGLAGRAADEAASPAHRRGAARPAGFFPRTPAAAASSSSTAGILKGATTPRGRFSAPAPAAAFTAPRHAGSLDLTRRSTRSSRAATTAAAAVTRWVTVSGVGPEHISAAIEALEAKFGPVQRHLWPGAGHNWFHVKFADALCAEQAALRRGLPLAAPSHNRAGGTGGGSAVVVGLHPCTDLAVAADRGAASPGASVGSTMLDDSVAASSSSSAGVARAPQVPAAMPGNLSAADVLRAPYFVGLDEGGGVGRFPRFRELRWWMRYAAWSTLALLLAALALLQLARRAYANAWAAEDGFETSAAFDATLMWAPGGGDEYYCEGEFCQ